MSIVRRAWRFFSGHNGLKLSKYTVAPRLRTRTVQRRIFSELQLRLLNTVDGEKGNY